MNKYLVITERGETGFGAYSPDLPGCIATGKTQDEVEARMMNAMQGHIEYLIEQGIPLTAPSTTAACMVALPSTLASNSGA